MNCGLLFCFLLSHYISDFMFQSNSLVEKRYSTDEKIRRKANLDHIKLYLIVTFIITFYYLSIPTVLGILLLAVFHFLIDKCKTGYTVKKKSSRYELAPFLLDQLGHLISIVAVIVPVSYFLPKKLFLENSFLKLSDFVYTFTSGISYTDKVILSATLFVIGVWGIGIFIRLFFNMRKYKKSEQNKIEKSEKNSNQKTGTEDGGYIIGLLERIFIICAVIIGIKEVIGFVLATKSIARLKKFEDDKFVEDFIIGSFMSFISAIIIGVIIRALNVFNFILPLQ